MVSYFIGSHLLAARKAQQLIDEGNRLRLRLRLRLPLLILTLPRYPHTGT
jgi:hypothetical protein